MINAITKTFAGLGGLVFMLLMIAQFIAYFNYSATCRASSRSTLADCSSRRTSARCRC